MTTLTHKDKIDLNRKARAHGLPDLWPAEEAKTANELLNKYLFDQQRGLAGSAYGGAGHLAPAPDWYFGIGFPQTPYWMTETAAEAVERFKREGRLGGVPGPPGSAAQQAYWPLDPPPRKAPSLWSRLRDRLRHLAGLA